MVFQKRCFAAMKKSMRAMIKLGSSSGLIRISAGNYGGKWGPYRFTDKI